MTLPGQRTQRLPLRTLPSLFHHSTFYEDWSFVMDEERSSMLPTMAAGKPGRGGGRQSWEAWQVEGAVRDAVISPVPYQHSRAFITAYPLVSPHSVFLGFGTLARKPWVEEFCLELLGRWNIRNW